MDELYYETSAPDSFGGVAALQRSSERGAREVEEWLSTQDAYTLHKPVRKKFDRRQTLSLGIDHLHQADLADMSSVARQNDGKRFVLIVIDVFSKFCWARAVADKSGLSIRDAYKAVLTSDSRRPVYLQTDRGKEFHNALFQELLRANGITLYSSQNYDVKCAVVERVIRTLKQKIYRYMTYKNTQRYVDALDDVVESYNRSFHRSIKTAPRLVNVQNESAIRARLYPSSSIKKKYGSKIRVGDRVRISELANRFRKGYERAWSNEIFTVFAIRPTRPPTYVIKDASGEIIEGRFYEQELQKIIKASLAPDVYRIERILRTKRVKGGKTRYLVRWSGYGPEHDSWVEDLLNV
jgi:transposase InsO family protein